MIPAILKICLSALLFYSSFVSIYINFVKKQADFYSLFFSISLCSLCLLLFYNTYKTIKPQLPRKGVNKSTPFFLLALCLVSLSIGFFNIHFLYEKRPVTNDESSQFRRSNKYNTITASYKEQQPPLDYYFSAFSSQMSPPPPPTPIYFLSAFILYSFISFYASSFLLASPITLLY